MPHLGERRGHQPLRRAAPAALRVLQPGVAQPGRGGRGRQHRLPRPGGPGAQRRPLPGQRHRRQPLPPGRRSRQRTLETRKIGLGVMGFADLLLKLGIPYNSEEAVAVAERGHGLHPGGVPAGLRPRWPTTGAISPLTRQPLQSTSGNGLGRMRNATTTTIAPTGTISIIAGLLQRHRAPVRRLLRPPGPGGHRTGGGPPLL